MTPELRLIRYFVVVAREGNITRAAQRLFISQPSLSAAIKQLEQQLDVALLARSGRGVTLTAAGESLLHLGQDLLDHADAVVGEVRQRDAVTAGKLRLGLSPTARYGIGPELLAACAAEAPAVMLYTSEDTTGALLRDVAQGRLDLALTFCAPARTPADLQLAHLFDEPAVVHLRADHPLAARTALSLRELASETILVAASQDSGGFTERVLSAFAEQGVSPETRVDPYPDLGLQAVREGVGVVVYARSAFPQALEGSAFVPVEPRVGLPFHLAASASTRSASVRAVIEIARSLATPLAAT